MVEIAELEIFGLIVGSEEDQLPSLPLVLDDRQLVLFALALDGEGGQLPNLSLVVGG